MGGEQDCPVLVVDDEDAIREVVTMILRAEGYPVRAVTDGTEALAAIQEIRAKDVDCPRLVLLDMRMPLMSGWDVARELSTRGIHVPIVVMTAARDAQRWAAEIGAEGFLAKPFDVDDLLHTVERLAGRP